MSKSGNECTSVGACSLCSWNGTGLAFVLFVCFVCLPMLQFIHSGLIFTEI